MRAGIGGIWALGEVCGGGVVGEGGVVFGIWEGDLDWDMRHEVINVWRDECCLFTCWIDGGGNA